MSWKQALSSLGLHQSWVWGLWAPTSLLGIPGKVTQQWRNRDIFPHLFSCKLRTLEAKNSHDFTCSTRTVYSQLSTAVIPAIPSQLFPWSQPNTAVSSF